MRTHGDSAPPWLFSFVDLAFLLLIAMTQISGDPNAPVLGEIDVPQIRQQAVGPLPDAARERWQLRVHPAQPGEQAGPFELVPAHASGAAPAARVAAPELRARLAELRAGDAARPVLAPHADSRTRDLLDAVDLLEESWPRRRSAIVARLPELR
jgi:hypothetical protein